MGCDIHLHVEVKINDEWYHYNHPNGLFSGSISRRLYPLFAKMAGVRNYGKIHPISLPKGLPEDITFITKFDYSREGNNNHDASWFNLQEIQLLEEWWKGQSWYVFGHVDTYFDEYFGYLFSNGFNEDTLKINNLQDARFVFWFDN